MIAAEPALAVELSPEQLDGALAAIANFVDLKSPFTLGHLGRGRGPGGGSRPPAWAAARGGTAAAQGRVRARLRAAGRVELDLGPARAAERRRVGAGPDVSLPDRTHAASVGGPGAARRDRGAAPRAPGRQRIPARAFWRRDLPAGQVLGAADAYQSMREPRPHRPARSAGGGGRGDARRSPGRPPGRHGRRCRARGGRSSRATPQGSALGPDRPRDRGAHPARTRHVQQADRRPAGDHPQDRRQPRGAHLRQDRRLQQGRCGMFAVQHGFLPEEKTAITATS